VVFNEFAVSLITNQSLLLY